MKKLKKPNGILYFLALAILWPYMKLVWHVNYKKKGFKRPKGPFIVVGNHVTFFDFISVALALYPRRINFVAAEYFFKGSLASILRFMGVIPKLQFVPDIGSIKAMIGAVKQGRALGLFPEGQVATYAHSDDFTPSGIGKLLKNLGVPVVLCKTEGASVVKPKWARKKRRCPLSFTVSNLLSADEIAAASAAQLDEILAAALFYDDSAYSLSAPLFPKGKARAEGLDSALYLCPRCGALYTYRSEGDRFFCTACGNEGTLDEHGLPIPKGPEDKIFPTLYDWHLFQKEYMKNEVAKDGFQMHSACEIHFPDAVLRGEASVTRDGIVLSAGDREELCPLANFQHMPSSVGKYFEIPRKNGIITVYTDEKREVMQWVDAVAALKKE